jgi:N-acetylneuraminate epimerase
MVFLVGAQVAISLAFSAEPLSPKRDRNALDWQQLPALPDREGFAGLFAGTSDGALLVAGGANFPDKKPWEAGSKVWHDSVFVLQDPKGPWRKAGTLPRPIAYGVSVSTPDGLLCIGGSDARQHHAEVFRLRWSQGNLTREEFPSLPMPCANMCGALVNHVVYIAGGTDSPTATNALKTFWALDLKAKPMRWQSLEPWPGPDRMLGVAGVHEGAFYLFSGVTLHPGLDGKAVRTYLQDAYRYRPGAGWTRIRDLPRAAAAAPSPAPLRESCLLVISGDDGALVNFEPKARHPGFPREVLKYDPVTSRWTRLEESPLSRATVPTVEWTGRVIIPSGETRPGFRSSEVWSFKNP